MHKGRCILILLVIAFLSGCGNSGLQKQSDGILITLDKQQDTDARKVKLQVCRENIIRVTAAPGNSFSSRPSLMVDKTEWPPVSWTVVEDSEQVILSTAKLSVRVNRKSGAVGFYDADNRLILNEKQGGGKMITPAEVMDEKTFHK